MVLEPQSLGVSGFRCPFLKYGSTRNAYNTLYHSLRYGASTRPLATSSLVNFMAFESHRRTLELRQ